MTRFILVLNQLIGLLLQVQYIVGSSGRQSYMAGWGNNPPTHIPNPAASCPTSVQPCAGFLASSPQYSSPDANPHVLFGALVSGPDARYGSCCKQQGSAVKIDVLFCLFMDQFLLWQNQT